MLARALAVLAASPPSPRRPTRSRRPASSSTTRIAPAATAPRQQQGRRAGRQGLEHHQAGDGHAAGHDGRAPPALQRRRSSTTPTCMTIATYLQTFPGGAIGLAGHARGDQLRHRRRSASAARCRRATSRSPATPRSRSPRRRRAATRSSSRSSARPARPALRAAADRHLLGQHPVHARRDRRAQRDDHRSRATASAARSRSRSAAPAAPAARRRPAR